MVRGPSARSRRRRILVVVGVAILAIVVLGILFWVPLESSAKGLVLITGGCRTVNPCPTAAAEMTVGDGRFAIVSGTWVTNGSAANIVVTVNNGPTAEACALCAGALYSSLGSTVPAGSFDVSGYGPFHISVNQIGFTAATTTIELTVDSTVL